MNKKKEMQRIYESQKEDGCILCKVLKQKQTTHKFEDQEKKV